jgi:hypothetical protein
MTDLSNLSDLLQLEEKVDVIEQSQEEIRRPSRKVDSLKYKYLPAGENNQKFSKKPKYYIYVLQKKMKK